jgi:GntR family phosphonate transport system transcriptional regulator
LVTGTPIWRSIAQALRSDIADGHYAPGAKLPTEAALASRFGVNRHTVRHAMASLAQEGLVHARRGAGVFVLARPLDYPLSERTRFHSNLLAAGRMPEKTILSVEIRAASAQDARRLRVSPDDVITVCHTLSFADSTPVALAESRFPEARLSGLADALRSAPGITKALARVGVTDYTRASTRLRAVTASATQALHLRLREGAPLLLAESLSHDGQGLPVEHGQTWFASERITLTLDHGSGQPARSRAEAEVPNIQAELDRS